MSVQTSTGLSAEVSTYYDRVFLARAEYEFVHKEGGQSRMHPGAEGKTINWTRYTPLAVATASLTEGSNPTETDLTASTVSVTLAEKGNSVKVSKFLSLISIDERDKEKIEVVGQNMGESLDTIVRDVLVTGATAQLAGANSAISDVAASDTMSAEELRKAVRTLETNKALTYPGRFNYIGKLQPYTKFDFTGDSTWENAKTYSDVVDLYRNEMGALHGVRLLNTKNGYSQSSTVTVYSNLIHGREAFGTVELTGDSVQLYIVPHSKIDHSNPTGRYGFISWAGTYACKVLNGNWIIDVQSGATA